MLSLMVANIFTEILKKTFHARMGVVEGCMIGLVVLTSFHRHSKNLLKFLGKYIGLSVARSGYVLRVESGATKAPA
ncbi:hypothetical protein [Akkermansia phage Moulinsart]|nr:hypothetical protein [Akkermansia phage Moulinsart]